MKAQEAGFKTQDRIIEEWILRIRNLVPPLGKNRVDVRIQDPTLVGPTLELSQIDGWIGDILEWGIAWRTCINDVWRSLDPSTSGGKGQQRDDEEPARVLLQPSRDPLHDSRESYPPCIIGNPRKNLMITAFMMSTKKAPTSGTTRKALNELPYLLVTAFI